MKIGLKYNYGKNSGWHMFDIVDYNLNKYKMIFGCNRIRKSLYFTKSTRKVVFFDKIRAAL